MRCQHRADVPNRIDERVRKPFISKMLAHHFDNTLPIKLAAFFVDRLIAHNREFARAGRYKNEDGVAFGRFVHPEPVKFLLRRNQRIAVQLSTLDIDPNLGRGLRLGLLNRPNDLIVLELA